MVGERQPVSRDERAGATVIEADRGRLNMVQPLLVGAKPYSAFTFSLGNAFNRHMPSSARANRLASRQPSRMKIRRIRFRFLPGTHEVG